MALTKTRTSIWSGTSQTAGSTTTSSAQDLSTYYGSALHIRITNGATGPTVAGQVLIEASADNSAWWDLGGALVGGTANSGVYEWTVIVPIEIKYVRLYGSGNTGQTITLDADILSITAL